MSDPARSRSILLVEDCADNADILARLLKFRGHHVQVARSGPEGLESAAATRPEVILLDLALPLMNGCEVASRLRATGEFDDLLIIAITGHGDQATRRLSVEAGIDHHLLKPFSMGELEELLVAGRRAG